MLPNLALFLFLLSHVKLRTVLKQVTAKSLATDR